MTNHAKELESRPSPDKFKNLLDTGHLQVFEDKFLNLHPRDQAEVFEDFENSERDVVYDLLEPKELADAFDIMEEDDEETVNYFKEMDQVYAADLLVEMYADNAVDILEQLDPRYAENLLGQMPDEDSAELRSMMKYEPETAGAIMTTEYVSFVENLTAKEALLELRELAPDAETISYIYVVDVDHRLLGVVSVRDLVMAADEVELHDIMRDNVVYGYVDDDQEEIAKVISDYNFLALPVLSQGQVLKGIVTIDDVLDVLEDEYAEDYSGLAGVDVEERHDTPLSAAKSRLPWLIGLLILGLGTSTLISFFEGIFAEVSVLVVFMSLVSSTAGNASTQSLAIAIRRLNDPTEDDAKGWSLFLRNIATGLTIGLIVGLIAGIIVTLWKDNFFLGLIVGLSIVLAVIFSNLAGAYVPRLIEALGFDPAVASGPFITTLIDLTSVVIYFTVASIFLPYLLA